MFPSFRIKDEIRDGEKGLMEVWNWYACVLGKGGLEGGGGDFMVGASASGCAAGGK